MLMNHSTKIKTIAEKIQYFLHSLVFSEVETRPSVNAPVINHKIVFISTTAQIQLGKNDHFPSRNHPKTKQKAQLEEGLFGLRRPGSENDRCWWGADLLILNRRKQMEKIFRIKPKLSLTPGKTVEGVYRVRLAKRTGDPKQGEIRQTLEATRGASLSPRKGKPTMVGLFRGARHIEPSETYLHHDKTQRQSKTKESSSPQVQQGHEQGRLPKPMGMARSNRSISGGKLQGRRGKAIQRTVSIVIEGAQATEQNQRELMDTLSRIILGEESQNGFLIEFIGQSSIHGEELNFVDLDSRLLTEEVTPDESSFLI